MPKIDGVGFGSFTPRKIESFSIIIEYHLLVTQAVLRKNMNYYSQEYHYLDLTAGCGSTPNGINGAALVFIQKVEEGKIFINTQAVLIECVEKHLQNLKVRIEERPIMDQRKKCKVEFLLGEYQKLIPERIKERNNDFGLIYVDPSGNIPDFSTLAYLAKKRPKMEILIYLPSTNVKRVFPYTNKKLTDHLESIEKRNWLIQKPMKPDKHKWTFLLGTNADNLFREYPSIEFYQVNSQKGQQILNDLNLTRKEKFEEIQPRLL